MRFRNTGIQSIGVSVLILVLLLSAGAFAYTTRIPLTNNHNNAPTPLDDNDSTTTSTSSSGSESHGSSSHTESERHSETQTGSTTHTETSESETEHHTETQTTTSGSNNNQGENNNNQEEHELKFRIVPATQGGTGQGEANIAIHGTVLKVDVEIEKAEKSTSYDVVLFAALTPTSGTTISLPTVSPSTTVSQSTVSATTATSSSTSSSTASSQTLGTIVTNDEGDGHLHTELQLPAGTYQIGISLSVSGTTQLTSNPEMQTAILSGSTSTESENTGKGENNANHVVKEQKQDEDNIRQAEDSKTIPAVIQVTASGSTTQVLDPRFSVSVGKTEGDGLAISITANNVTGPKVLLINLTNTYDPTSRSLNVTLDGKTIEEASSVAQVLSPSATDPPRFLIVTTTSGSQLLVSIPHFSLHIIQVLPFALTTPPAAQNFLATNSLLLVGSAIAIVAVSAAVIAMKRRIQP